MTAQSPASAPPSARPPEFGVAYTRYALFLLLLVYVFNIIDRQIINILIEAIKEEFDLSDTQLGFFGGTAFGIFYATLGIPIARYADRRVRRNVIALALAVWSLMTAMQALAVNFVMLAAARIGVGVGEAGCSPPAHSMISDYIPPERRATALGLYAAGIPIGGAIGLMAGGWIRDALGWREALLIVGLPGVLLALVVLFTLKEPQRGYYDPLKQSAATRPTLPLREVFAFLGRLASFRHIAIGAALHGFAGYGAASFAAPFFERIHDFSASELGFWLGLITLIAGSAGALLGGFMSDRLAARDLRWYARLPGLATLFGIPFAYLYYMFPDRYWALIFGVIPIWVNTMFLAPTFALTQALVPPHLRTQASAILLFIINIIGLGLGPQFVGMLSDLLEAAYGVESIRYALLWTVCIASAWSALHYILAERTLHRDLQMKEEIDW